MTNIDQANRDLRRDLAGDLGDVRGDILVALMESPFAADAGRIRAVVMPAVERAVRRAGQQ